LNLEEAKRLLGGGLKIQMCFLFLFKKEINKGEGQDACDAPCGGFWFVFYIEIMNWLNAIVTEDGI
jgi:hypothetical protein